MTPAHDIRELLPLYALGILEPDEARAVERALADDPVLVAELAAYQDSADQLVAPVAPSPAVKARLLASVGGGPFERFADRVAALYDVAVERAREFLGLIERPASWEGKIPGISLVHFDGGARYAEADCGFIRVAVGAVFPPHSHIGEERCIVLQGRLHDVPNNRMIETGDEYVQVEGTEHYLVNVGDVDCIFAARAMHGISVAGAPVRLGKPPVA